jgi:hypothetical protein
LNGYENDMLNLYQDIARNEAWLIASDSTLGIANTWVSNAAGYGAATASAIISTAAQTVSAGLKTNISELQNILQRTTFRASHQRRVDEWTLQSDLANQGIKIGNQKIKIANQQVQVVGQERTISQLQLDNADASLTYLQNKFTNADLYEWMSGIIDTIFRYYINQATAMAKMAADQLYFERQLRDIPIIQNNYYTLPNENSGSIDGSSTNRKGLTASSLLQQDISKLEQYAFETDRRKLQLTKTISLAKMNPFEFQVFKKTGEIDFRTKMEMFDKDFPGHYLRIIKKVRVSVIALIPAVDGIKASLTNVGSSRVVIKGDLFSEEHINRGPESVSLTSPINASGLFEMEQNSAEMLFPFEGIGVDTMWNFALPKPANSNIDFNTIADVQISIDYTAFEDYDLRNKTVKLLQQEDNDGEIFLSFKNNLPDQWYDLSNSDTNDKTIKFNTTKVDFPTSINGITIGKVKMLFSYDETKANDGNAGAEAINISSFDNKFITLKLNGKGGEANSENGSITKSNWNFDGEPFGEWEFTMQTSHFIKAGFITDILLVIGFSGEPLNWPSSYSLK